MNHTTTISKAHNSVAHQSPWLVSPGFDLLAFFLPFILGCVLFACATSATVANSIFATFLITQGFGIGPFHQGLTWHHYFDRTNQQYFLASNNERMRYILIPLAMFSVAICAFQLFPKLFENIFVLWTIWHLVQQNIGISLLYKNRDSGEAAAIRSLEVSSQRSAAALCSLIFAYRLIPHDAQQGGVIAILIASATVLTLVLCSRYILQLRSQIESGSHLNAPSFCFWLYSIFFFVPFAFWGSDYRQSLSIPLIMHWCQYIGLNYVLTRNKSAMQANSAPTILLPLLGTMMVLLVGTSGFLSNWFNDHSGLGKLMNSLVYALAFVHYWQDSIFWKFSVPHNRANVLPYLKGAQI